MPIDLIQLFIKVHDCIFESKSDALIKVPLNTLEDLLVKTVNTQQFKFYQITYHLQ